MVLGPHARNGPAHCGQQPNTKDTASEGTLRTWDGTGPTPKSGRCELWALKAACLRQPLHHQCSCQPPSEHIRLPCSSTGQQRRRRWLCSQASPATLLPSYSHRTEMIWLPLWGPLAGAQQQPFCATAHIVLHEYKHGLVHRAINKKLWRKSTIILCQIG